MRLVDYEAELLSLGLRRRQHRLERVAVSQQVFRGEEHHRGVVGLAGIEHDGRDARTAAIKISYEFEGKQILTRPRLEGILECLLVDIRGAT